MKYELQYLSGELNKELREKVYDFKAKKLTSDINRRENMNEPFKLTFAD